MCAAPDYTWTKAGKPRIVGLVVRPLDPAATPHFPDRYAKGVPDL
jgi:hypothetical protein